VKGYGRKGASCWRPSTHEERRSHWRPTFHCGKTWSTCTARASIMAAPSSPPRVPARLAPLFGSTSGKCFSNGLFVKIVLKKG
jgi:hypothetical protein